MLLQIRKSWLLPLMMGIVITAALVLTTPVSADDGQPMDPQPATEVATQPQTGSSASTDTTTPPQTPADEPAVQSDPAPIVESAPADPAPSEAQADPAAAPVDTAPTEAPAIVMSLTEVSSTEPSISDGPDGSSVPQEDATVQEAVTALAENGITLAAPSGDPVVLASNEAGGNLATGDPYFKVGSVTYQFLKTGCTANTPTNICIESATPIQAALDYMSDPDHILTPTDRMLYIQPDTYSDFVMVDGTLNGVKGLLGIVGQGTPENTTIESIYIRNILYGFSLSNLHFSGGASEGGAAIAFVDDKGVLQLTNVTADTTSTNGAAIWFTGTNGQIVLTDVTAKATKEDSSGILVNHTGSVILNRVDASGNGYMGARIASTGAVSINNSQFDHNLNSVNDGLVDYDTCYDDSNNPYPCANYTGLVLYTDGSVTLYGISASDNAGTGADISTGGAITINNSVFNNNTSTSDDWGDGLKTDGSIITISNIVADNNHLDGIESWVGSSFTGTQLHAEKNGGDGFNIIACYWMGQNSPYCENPGMGTVTINTAHAYLNGGTGFDIAAKGVITLTDVWSGTNTQGGYYLDNSDAATPANISITNVQADSNSQSGFDIFSRGAVTLTNIMADNNTGGDGLMIDNSAGTGNVIITGASKTYNETDNNSGNGLTITSRGAVTLTNLDACGNDGYGAFVDNNTALTAAPVTVNTNWPAITWHDGFDDNGSFGLEILSRGIVTLSIISANGNSSFGAMINNIPTGGTVPGAAVAISDSEFFNNTDNDTGTHTENGLSINSKGSITLLNVDIENNDGYGASLNNQMTGATGGITINAGTNLGNTFENNYYDGLRMQSNGAVTLTNIKALSNTNGYGVYIDNSTGTGSVSIKETGNWGANFNYYDQTTWGNAYVYNGYDGIYIQTKGAVSVIFNHASENGSNGINVVAPNSAGSVTVSGSANHEGDAYKNGQNGIIVTTKGSITLNNIYATNNSGYGAVLQNNPGTGSISLTDAYFENNRNGLNILTTGSVYWKNGSAVNNSGSGAYINNEVDTLVGKPVTIINVQTTSNSYTGLYIVSKGAVILTDVEANNNSFNNFGVNLDDYRIDNLTDNQIWWFDSFGSASTPEKVTIKIQSDRFNPHIYLYSPGGNYVADIAGTDGVIELPVELTESGEYQLYVSNNDGGYEGFGYEMWFYTTGVDPATKTDWHKWISNANGISVDNSSGNNAPVTITSSTQRWNGNNSGTDIKILSSGAVTLKNMDLNDSSQSGLVVDNTTSKIIAGVINPGVTLTNINFYSNDLIAADIRSNGAVVVTTSDLADNFGGGYNIDNDNSTAISSVTFTGVNVHYNGLAGIIVASKGAVSLKNVDINNNQSDGLYLLTNGTITFSNVNASNNGGYGAQLINNPGTGSISLTNAYFENNWDGLKIITTGSVYWKNGSAANNSGSGANINNKVDTLAGKPVTIINVQATNNGLTGLNILSKGTVTITDVDANNNSSNHFTVDLNDQVIDNLTDNQIWWFDSTIDNEQVTIKIQSDRFNPYVYVVDPNGNFISDMTGTNGFLELPVTLPQTGSYQIFISNNDGSYNGFGYEMWFYTTGVDPATKTDWHKWTSNANGISVDNSAGNNAPVTITNTTHRWDGNNSGTDINILSSGAVTLSNMDINDSSQSGLFVNNTTAKIIAGMVTPGVTLTNVNFYNNDQTGADIQTNGAVVVTNGNATGNSESGYAIDNGNTAISSVTLTNVWTANNGSDGFNINSKGAVSFNYVSAYGNGGYGAYVDTQGTFTLLQPTNNNLNQYNGNGTGGLYVVAGGKVTLAKVFVHNNGIWDDDGNPTNTADGIHIINTANTLGTAPVTLTDVETDNNTGNGIFMVTDSAVTLTSVNANNNTGFGLSLNQTGAPNSLLPISLNKFTANSNGEDGIYINAKGNIIVNKLTVNSNTGNGVNLINTFGTGSVTILNTLGNNSADFNGGVGMNIESNGAVTVTGLEVAGNGNDGIDVDNSSSGSLIPAAVSLNSITSRNNNENGISVNSKGIITLNNSWSVGNSRSGILAVTTNNIFINNTSAINNKWNGFYTWTGDPGNNNTLKLTHSTWFGNLRDDPFLGDKNLVYTGKIIIA